MADDGNDVDQPPMVGRGNRDAKGGVGPAGRARPPLDEPARYTARRRAGALPRQRRQRLLREWSPCGRGEGHC